MASLSEMLITPKSAALPAFASCAAADLIPKGIDVSAIAAVQARERDRRMECCVNCVEAKTLGLISLTITEL